MILLLLAQPVSLVLLSAKAAAVASGDGLIVYGEGSNTNPRTRNYTSSTNLFGSEAATVAGAAGTDPRVTVTKTSPTKQESIVGYINSSGTLLQIMCYDGSSWTNDWSVSVTGATTATRWFDIAYEEESGDVMVMYSTRSTTTNELAYRTKSGSDGCGSGNWSGATNLTSAQINGAVRWVKLAWDRRSTSNLITAVWESGNGSTAAISASVWSGTAWGNEPTGTSALGGDLWWDGVAADEEVFDVEYESLSGDVMVAWGESTNALGMDFATCTGGTSSCTWSLDSANNLTGATSTGANMDMSANPNSNEIVLAGIGGNNSLTLAYWSGSGWTVATSPDTSTAAAAPATKLVSTGWLTAGGTTRSIIAYNDSAATNIGWFVGNGGTFTVQTDDTSTTPAFASPQKVYDIQMDPINQDRLMLTVSDNASDLLAKRLVMTSTPTFDWTDANGSAALETALGLSTVGDFSFAYWQHSTFELSAFRDYENANSVDPGAALAAQDVRGFPYAVGPARFRLLLHIGETALMPDDRTFKLQVAAKSGTCDTGFVGETYADLNNSSGAVRYYNNATPADGAIANGLAADPVHSGHTNVAQTYEELNNFTSEAATPSGQDALWDFAVEDVSAFGAYCFRVVNSDGSEINTYTKIPEIGFCNRPQTTDLLRHGSFFCDETEQKFFWSL